MSRRSKALVLMFVLALAASISVVSAHPNVASHALGAASESSVVGAEDTCAKVAGLGAGLAVGALSPCSVFCAVGAFYAAVYLTAAC